MPPDLALSLGQTPEKIAAELANVPRLKSAAQRVPVIVEQAARVPTNRGAVAHLRDRCYLIVLAVKDLLESSPSAQYANSLSTLEKALQEVEGRVGELTKMQRLVAFSRRAKIEGDLAACHRQLDNCLKAFSLTNQALCKWQQLFELTTKRDHARDLEMFVNLDDQSATTRGIKPSHMFLDLISYLQKSLEHQHEPKTRHGVESQLYQLQKHSGQLLPDIRLEKGEVVRLGTFPVSGNSRMDIWEGLFLSEEKVTVKVVRAVVVNEKTLKRFEREVRIWWEIWKADKGCHVLPFYGFCMNDGPCPYMVSPWQPNGTAINWVLENPNVDHKALIRGIAEGIEVLHTFNPPVVHGDIKGTSIVIDTHGMPLIADFGLAKMVEDINGIPVTHSTNISDAYRWYSPELCRGEAMMSMSSDIYAYSMTVVELMTHERPFHQIHMSSEVVVALCKGTRPNRPTDEDTSRRGLDDSLWALLMECWCTLPSQRLPIQTVVQKLRAMQ